MQTTSTPASREGGRERGRKGGRERGRECVFINSSHRSGKYFYA